MSVGTQNFGRRHAAPSLRWQLCVALIAMAALAVVVGGELLRSYETDYLSEQAQLHKQKTLALIAATAIDAIISEDIPLLSTILEEAIKIDPELLSLEVATPRNKKLYGWNSKSVSTNAATMTLENEATFEGSNFGHLKGTWDLTAHRAAIQQHVFMIRLLVAAFLLALTLVVMACLDTLVLRPLENIAQRLRGGGNKSPATAKRELSRELEEIDQLIEERLRAEAALRFSRHYLDYAGDPTFWADKQGQAVYVNIAAAELLGCERELIQKQALTELFTSLHRGTWPEFWDSLHEKQRISLETECRTFDSTPIPVELSITLLRFESSEYCCIFARDIRERLKTQAELVRATELAQAASVAKGNFLANMSHEIRTPMNGILGMASILAETDLKEEQKEFLEIIQGSAQSLLTIINDILDFSKAEAGKIRVDPIEFALRDALMRTLAILTPLASARGIDLIADIDPSVPEHFLHDQGRLQQVVTNLISNAIKFTEQGQVFLRASALTLPNGHMSLRLEVEDTGVGIPEDRIEAIFVPFEQADSSTTRKFGGTGLGLSIARTLCRLMGGDLTARSVLGKGSVFSVEVVTPTPFSTPPWPSLDAEGLRGTPVVFIDQGQVTAEVCKKTFEYLGMSCTNCVAENIGAHLDPRAIYFIVKNVKGEDNGILWAQRLISAGIVPARIGMFIEINETASEKAALRSRGIVELIRRPVASDELLAACLRMTGVAQIPRIGSQAIMLETNSAPRMLRILVAEDNKVNQLIIQKILSKLGHEVVVVDNGALALEALDKSLFNLVFMDIQMPVLDGIEAVRRIRAPGGAHQFLPVVALTAHALEEERTRCREAGMNEHLTKPIEREKLEEVLARYVGKD